MCVSIWGWSKHAGARTQVQAGGEAGGIWRPSCLEFSCAEEKEEKAEDPLGKVGFEPMNGEFILLATYFEDKPLRPSLDHFLRAFVGQV